MDGDGKYEKVEDGVVVAVDEEDMDDGAVKLAYELPGGYCEIGVDRIGDSSGSSNISHDSRASDGSAL